MVDAKSNRSYRRKSLLRVAIAVAALIVLNIVFSRTFYRFDLTKEKRFSISMPTKELLKQLDDNVYFAVFLRGDLPAEYRKLQRAITEMLDEYNAYSGNRIQYDLVDPFDQPNDSLTNEFLMRLVQQGLQERQLAQQSADEASRKIIFPGAMVFYKDDEGIPINFLAPQKSVAENTEVVVNSGIAMLEYNLSNTVRKLIEVRKKRIVFIQGHNEFRPIQVGDLGMALQDHRFDVEFMDLPSQVNIPNSIDVIVIAGPRSTFDERDKFKIDQYLMNGGKALWFIDPLHASLDSLLPPLKEAEVTYDYPLNLEDQLFQYGVRINLDLVQDVECNGLPLGRDFRPWYLYPVLLPDGRHPITKHLDPVMSMFASSIDTIKVPDVKKTILLTSSNQSRLAFHPVNVNLGLTQMPATPEFFNKSKIPVAVLLEGEFQSIFRNRMTSQFLSTYEDSLQLEFKELSKPTKMIVVSDADIIRNEVASQGDRYLPQTLGFYRWGSGYVFSNKDFVMNCIDYLVDNHGLIESRNKEFKIRPLNKEKVKAKRVQWQMTNLFFPVAAVILFGLVFNYLRKRKHTS